MEIQKLILHKQESLHFKQTNIQTSNRPDLFQGVLLIVVIGALIFFFSMVEDLEDIQEYAWQLSAIFLMLGGSLYSTFKRRASLIEGDLFLREKGIKIVGINLIPYEELYLDRYYADEKFSRYHLYDSKGRIAIYSVYEDELIKTLVELRLPHLREFQEREVKKRGSAIHYGFDKDAFLIYDYESGAYEFKGVPGEERRVVPQAFAVDPKYVPLEKLQV